jgi:alpha-beta hydrolase superfamily lysophospholipase
MEIKQNMSSLSKHREGAHSICKNIEYLQHHNASLALHSWIPSSVQAVLFYMNGVQSHAGWSFETGIDLAKKGIAFYVLDRRGSGLSSGLRGDIPSATFLLEDYYLTIQHVKKHYPKHPLTLMGHSLGGSLLAGLLSWPTFDVSYDAAVFCASALGKLHLKLSADEQKKLVENKNTDPWPLNLDDLDYTDDPRYLNFIKNDPYCCRAITQRSRVALFEIENLYWQKTGALAKVSSAYVHPKSDPLVNLYSALAIFSDLSAGQGLTLQLPATKHYMWFTEHRHALAKWLSHYVLTGGYKK